MSRITIDRPVNRSIAGTRVRPSSRNMKYSLSLGVRIRGKRRLITAEQCGRSSQHEFPSASKVTPISEIRKSSSVFAGYTERQPALEILTFEARREEPDDYAKPDKHRPCFTAMACLGISTTLNVSVVGMTSNRFLCKRLTRIRPTQLCDCCFHCNRYLSDRSDKTNRLENWPANSLPVCRYRLILTLLSAVGIDANGRNQLLA